jgi:3-oxoacyl-[acyl-carrier-protein] synthase III
VERLARDIIEKSGITPDIILVTTSHLPPRDTNNQEAQLRANHVREYLRSLNLPTPITSEDPFNTMTISTACSGFTVGLDLLRQLDPVGQNVMIIAEETGYRRTLLPPAEDSGKAGLLFSDTAAAMQFTYGEDLTVLSSVSPQYDRNDPNNELLSMNTPDYDESAFLTVIRPPHTRNFIMNGPGLRKYFEPRITADEILRLSFPAFNPKLIDVVATHQASKRMVDYVGTLGFDSARAYSAGISTHGNTSSASLILELNDGLQNGGIMNSGDVVLTVGYGAGLTWSAAVVQIGQH